MTTAKKVTFDKCLKSKQKCFSLWIIFFTAAPIPKNYQPMAIFSDISN